MKKGRYRFTKVVDCSTPSFFKYQGLHTGDEIVVTGLERCKHQGLRWSPPECKDCEGYVGYTRLGKSRKEIGMEEQVDGETGCFVFAGKRELELLEEFGVKEMEIIEPGKYRIIELE